MNYTQLWLDYKPVKSLVGKSFSILCLEHGEIIDSILSELNMAIEAMTGSKPSTTGLDTDYVIRIALDEEAPKNGYIVIKDGCILSVRGRDCNALLYGGFELLRQLQIGDLSKDFKLEKAPAMPLRMANHWDNMDGSIERGYSGKSFFFENNRIVINQRTKDYARFLASVGINATVINNVNVRGEAPFLIDKKHRSDLIKLSKVFAAYGVKLYLSINFASPVRVGGLSTADPLAKEVIDWWGETCKELFTEIPNFGGFLVKADSEGEFGPFAYGRTHADGANMLARSVKPYGGIIIWRCFVYNCQQDWRDNVTDRACQSYNNFIGLDGSLDDNVILQVKNGPVDFQVREPVHPLFGGLKNTNIMLEFQIAQEYTGQQRHVCYLMPQFKEVLDFNTYNGEKYPLVKDIVAGKNAASHNFGMAAVMNTGSDENWTGHDLAAANFYGFARLAFEPDLSSEQIAGEWVKLTYGCNEKVCENVVKILMMSYPAYEKYNAPMAIGWMVNPNIHFGPNVDGYEYDRWGTYHRISHSAIGRDRSSRGTGYSQQYPEPLRSMYDSIDTCPEELLLFFHRVRFDHIMSTGETLLQRIYDTHFEGAEDAEKMLSLWKELDGLIKPAPFERALKRLEFQSEHAKEWRDRINTYFWRMTEIPDAKGRKIYE